jgi:four helix bundle protein
MQNAHHAGFRHSPINFAVRRYLNIAEGSGKGDRDAARFYTIARGSALECAAILDVLEALGAATPEDLRLCRELLERIVSMLTKLRKA